MKIVLLSFLGCFFLLTAALALSAEAPPKFAQAVQWCMERQGELDPLTRSETCLCVAETKSTFLWSIRRMVSLRIIDADAALVHTCRARAFSLNPRESRDLS